MVPSMWGRSPQGSATPNPEAVPMSIRRSEQAFRATTRGMMAP
jgi:hypothetical protein